MSTGLNNIGVAITYTALALPITQKGRKDLITEAKKIGSEFMEVLKGFELVHQDMNKSDLQELRDSATYCMQTFGKDLEGKSPYDTVQKLNRMIFIKMHELFKSTSNLRNSLAEKSTDPKLTDSAINRANCAIDNLIKGLNNSVNFMRGVEKILKLPEMPKIEALTRENCVNYDLIEKISARVIKMNAIVIDIAALDAAFKERMQSRL